MNVPPSSRADHVGRRTALLVVDLEGVAGVDELSALVAGSPKYPDACVLLTREVVAAVNGLLDAGFDHVRVSDSHRAGVMRANVVEKLLPPGASLHWEPDAYSEALFDGVDAVACLGMHAGAGTGGFAAHTVDIHCAWSAGGNKLSEADIVLALAAEREVPVVFVSGDDRLGATLPRGIPFVQTKRSVSPSAARSEAPDSVHAALARAARQAPLRTRPLRPLPLRLRFKSRWQAELAVAQSGAAASDDPRSVWFEGTSFRDRYTRAYASTELAGDVFSRVVRGTPGTAVFQEDAVALLTRTFAPSRPRPLDLRDRAKRALTACLGRFDGDAEWQVTDLALTLHMLRGHAPKFFKANRLHRALARALERLAAVPATFEPSLDPTISMARVDAIYLRHLHGLTGPQPDVGALRHCIQYGSFQYGAVWAWLLNAMCRRAGIELGLSISPRAMRFTSRAQDLYALTHLVLLESDYFARPLERSKLAAEAEELLLATSWVLREREVDVAAEVAFSLQALRETDAPEYVQAMRLVAKHQRADGTVLDPSAADDEDADRRAAHATAAALIAFAGHEALSARPAG